MALGIICRNKCCLAHDYAVYGLLNEKIMAGIKLGIISLATINVIAVFDLTGIAAQAEYGFSAIFYYLFAALFFLVPISFVAAELATSWPEQGGVFRWVGEAFGPRWGFVAIFLQWGNSSFNFSWAVAA
jgi:amino acid transporter